MAEKLKKSSEKKNAEAVSSKAAQVDKDDVEEITLNALAGVKTNVEDTVEDTIKEIILEPEVIGEQDEPRPSLAARALRGLLLVSIGIIVALWGAPKLAPVLPAGLGPVAEFLMPGQSDAKASVAALRAELDQKLANVLKSTGIDQTAINKSISANAVTQAEEIEIIKDALFSIQGQDIETRIALLESQFKGLSAEISTVTERVILQIPKNDAILSETAATELSGYSAALEKLKSQVSELSVTNSKLSQKIEEASKASSRRIKEAEKEATKQVVSTAIKKNLADVAIALDRGGPFKASLDALALATGVKIPESLAIIAVNGTTSWLTLRNGFSDVAHKALRADIRAKADDGSISKLGAFFKTQVGTRSLERKEGPETDAILSRVEDDLLNRRLDAALIEANSLPSSVKSAISVWVAKLGALSAAHSDFKDFSSAVGAL
ncbi:MAG TPA: hypothetical protein DCF96_08085 [Rhodobacteraceae bacterium]|nr:hypothetical protein [Paracoccaceae bacterium]